MLLLSLTLSLPLAASPGQPVTPAPPPWYRQDFARGVLLETRDVPGSAFEEIRVTTDNPAKPDQICEAVWGGNTQALERGFKQRQTLQETPQERWTYERVGAPMAHDRDYTIHVAREVSADGGCVVRFETQNDKGPPPQDGAVRVPAIHGSWEVSAQPTGTHIVYVVYSEPGGRIPAFLAKGGQRSSAMDWMKIILGRVETMPQHANR